MESDKKEKMDEHGKGSSPPENYERFFVPSIGAPLAKNLIHLAALRPGERVLDVACGTGIVARLAFQQVGSAGSVAGLDVNPGMLAVARSATPQATSIGWHEASAQDMPFPDASFDVVLCQMGLQFIPDKHAALREMQRVLKPGGRVVLSVPGPTPVLFAVMREALARFVSARAAGFVDQVFSLHDAAEIQSLIEGSGFHDVSVQADTARLRLPLPEEFLWQYVQSTPLAPVVAQAGEERRRLLERDIVAKWQEFVEDSSLLLQARVVAATARK